MKMKGEGEQNQGSPSDFNASLRFRVPVPTTELRYHLPGLPLFIFFPLNLFLRRTVKRLDCTVTQYSAGSIDFVLRPRGVRTQVMLSKPEALFS